jgi:hypothetical protein
MGTRNGDPGTWEGNSEINNGDTEKRGTGKGAGILETWKGDYRKGNRDHRIWNGDPGTWNMESETMYHGMENMDHGRQTME